MTGWSIDPVTTAGLAISGGACACGAGQIALWAIL